MSDWSAGEASDRASNAAAKAGQPLIKPSRKGLLHKKLGVPQGENIPKGKLAVKPSDPPALVKEKTFAKNFGKKK